MVGTNTHRQHEEYKVTPFNHMRHRNGGRILSLSRIEHVTERGNTYWFFVGTVHWDDQKEGESTREFEISPVHLSYEDAQGETEANSAFNALSAYLLEHGDWQPKGGWIPREKNGSMGFKQALSLHQEAQAKDK